MKTPAQAEADGHGRATRKGQHMAGSASTTTPRRARRHELVQLRHEAARRWAESASHGLDDSYSHLEEMCRLEDVLRDGWPRYFARYREQWVRRDAAVLHSDEIGDATCRHCRAATVASTA